jgi:outer membrane protein assembly factor BamB
MVGLGVGVDYALFIVTRYRETYRRNGGDVRAAVGTAMDTAGRAIIFAGLTVVIALLGMFALGVALLNGVAISAALAVLFVLAASLTLLPALLTIFGHRIGRPSLLARRRGTAPPDRSTFWTRWIAAIQRRPRTALVASAVLMVVLTIPVFRVHLGNTDAGNDPPNQTTRRAYDLVARGFGQGFGGPLLVAVRLPLAGDTAALRSLETALRRTPGVAAVAPPRISPNHEVATLVTYPTTSPQSTQTEQLVRHLRRDVIPPLEQRTGLVAFIGGTTAAQIDFSAVLGHGLPYFIGVVVLLSALLLMVVFRSLLIPLQAAVMNLLSIGASMGIVVAVFQFGWGGSLLGIAGGPIMAFLPVMVFAIVFGLSMDYEVFLVSRIHEEWTHGADNTRAVREGLIRTGRVITAAAAVMVVVFASFIGGGQRVIEMFGLALASAVFLDALVIRVLLLPATLQLLGEATWWFPDWLDRRLPLLAVVAAGVYEAKHPYGGSVLGSARSEFDRSRTVSTRPADASIPVPMFGGGPQRLHVGVGRLRPPFRLDWQVGGTSLIEFPPSIGFHRLFYANANGDLIAISANTGSRAWVHHFAHCVAASPALNTSRRGSVYETFLNRKPCSHSASRGEGEVVSVAGGINRIHWQKQTPATETSPLIVGNGLYVGDAQGDVFRLRPYDGKTVWTFHAGGAVKGGIAYDRGTLLFGAYDGCLYAVSASTGKLVWRSASDRSIIGRHGTFYSTPAVAYSRVYIGSTDHNVYSYGEQTGKLRWVFATGGYVYGSPTVWDGRVLIGSYDGSFYALDAATGAKLWSFRANGPISGSATVVDGIVYFATLKGSTYGIDARTGKLVWHFHDGRFTPVVTDGHRLFVVGWAKIYAFSPRHGRASSG